MGRFLEARAWMITRERLPNATARLVLVRMAHTAMDTDDAPTYYGGWDTLALALGYDTYNRAAERAVARAVAQLVEAGLIKPDGDARGGNRRYRLDV